MLVNIDSPEKFQSQFDVSRETLSRMCTYNDLLQKWNQKINLVSRNSISHSWHRHFSDAAQLVKFSPINAKQWLDIGSGAGFPGMVAAIILAETSPNTQVTLVDSDIRKMTFLAAVAREVGVEVKLLSARISDIPAQNADVISARALAPLDKLLTMSAIHCHPDTILLFQKGETYESELTLAKRVCHKGPEILSSITDENSVILRFKGNSIVV